MHIPMVRERVRIAERPGLFLVVRVDHNAEIAEVVGLDQSASMLDVARRQAPNASYVDGDALALSL